METIEWENGVLKIIDQTRLPTQEVVLYIGNIKDCRKAIERLEVRGAPAIGDAAAFGVVLGLKEIQAGISTLSMPNSWLLKNTWRHRGRPRSIFSNHWTVWTKRQGRTRAGASRR